LDDLRNKRAAVVEKANALWEIVASDEKLSKLSGGSSLEVLLAKNPELQKVDKSIAELERQLDELMTWGLYKIAKEFKIEQASALAQSLKARPLFNLAESQLLELIQDAAKEQRMLTLDELVEVEKQLPNVESANPQSVEAAR
jgi:hypothetical protein